MNKFLLTMVTLNALALPAMAADLTPVYKEQTVWTWTGFYFGGTVGGGWMSSNSTETVSTSCAIVAICPAFAAAIPGGYNTTKAGFLAGVEVGYNWQFGRYVLGIETDLSGASISGSSAATNEVPIAGFLPVSIGAYGTHSEKLDYLGTVRGRAGFLVTDPLLVYVTGGFAYGDASSSNSLGASVVPGCAKSLGLPPEFCAQSATGESSSSKRAGWTIGGGLDAQAPMLGSLKATSAVALAEGSRLVELRQLRFANRAGIVRKIATRTSLKENHAISMSL